MPIKIALAHLRYGLARRESRLLRKCVSVPACRWNTNDSRITRPDGSYPRTPDRKLCTPTAWEGRQQFQIDSATDGVGYGSCRPPNSIGLASARAIASAMRLSQSGRSPWFRGERQAHNPNSENQG